MSTKPDRAYTERSLCDCGYRDPSAVSPMFHGDQCLLRKADHANWQAWAHALSAWEHKAQSDIKAMRLTAEALDYIEDSDGVRYGDMSVRSAYCLQLLRDLMTDEDGVLLSRATDHEIATELRRRGHTGTENRALRTRVSELEEYAEWLERGLSAHEAREIVWPGP